MTTLTTLALELVTGGGKAVPVLPEVGGFWRGSSHEIPRDENGIQEAQSTSPATGSFWHPARLGPPK